MSNPTDCDQRDERLGWLGDTNLSGESMLINFESTAFFAWWLRYVVLPELKTDGSLPDVAPFSRFGGRPADVSWSAALPTTLYQLWKVDGHLQSYTSFGAAAIAAQMANVAAQVVMPSPCHPPCPPLVTNRVMPRHRPPRAWRTCALLTATGVRPPPSWAAGKVRSHRRRSLPPTRTFEWCSRLPRSH